MRVVYNYVEEVYQVEMNFYGNALTLKKEIDISYSYSTGPQALTVNSN